MGVLMPGAERQWEAAKAPLPLLRAATAFRIVLPQAAKTPSRPPSASMVQVIKGMVLASIIGLSRSPTGGMIANATFELFLFTALMRGSTLRSRGGSKRLELSRLAVSALVTAVGRALPAAHLACLSANQSVVRNSLEASNRRRARPGLPWLCPLA